MNDPSATVIEQLHERILGYGKRNAIVAFSGGVDSSVVLALAAGALSAEAVLAVTAVSPSLPDGEIDSARLVAATLAVRHRLVETREVEAEAYARNDALRCFHCKDHVYGVLSELRSAAEPNSDAVLLAGANADDVADLRPGLLAARRYEVRNPLLEAGLSKSTVRSIAGHLGLSVADKPAMACLSSRVAYGMRITPELLNRIDIAERAMRVLGFAEVRVRHRGETAVIEVPGSDVRRLLDPGVLPGVTRRLGELGWTRVVVDPGGLRSGSMNDGVTLTPGLRRALSLLAPIAS